jgi:mono/diheme cytochrome c family protein
MKTVLLTLLIFLGVELVGTVGFIYSGWYDVAAVHPDNRLVAWAIRQTSNRSVAARLGGIQVPAGLDSPERIAGGGRLYALDCVVCHGGPGLRPTGIARGLNPTPPDLFRAGRHVRMAEVFWFISNGVKMTAMPGFEKSRTADEIWSLAAFLGTAPGMSAADFSTATGIAQPAGG